MKQKAMENSCMSKNGTSVHRKEQKTKSEDMQ